MSKDRVCLLVHSGSRGLGEILLRRHTEVFGAGGLECESGEGVDYLQGHDYAVRWAALNRQVIATRFCENLGIEAIRVLDNCHNQVTPAVVAGHQGWLHRKGAAQADRGLLVIPGSRGAFSYLVEPRGFQERNLWSLAHGAGRKWSRKSCKDRLRERTSPEALRRSSLGSTVICEDRELLFEEAPQAYKNIETVIEDMVGEELIRVVATLRPLVTYKTRKN